MRSNLLTATDERLAKIRYEKKIGKRIWKMIKVTAVIVLVISLFSTLNTILVNQSDDAIRDRDILDKLNLIDQSIDTMQENRSTGQIESLGTFTVTHYCPCEKCCGKSDEITATGTTATEGRTIAVDPDVIPLGTEVEIDGRTYIAEDVGGAIKGNRVDIFVGDHSTALSRGRFEREVRQCGSV